MKGGYDMTAFWCRAGTAATITPPGHRGHDRPAGAGLRRHHLRHQPRGRASPRRCSSAERTGEPSVVDVSLLGSGLWSMGQGTVALTEHLGQPMVGARPACTARRSTRWSALYRDLRRPLHLAS